MPRPTHPGPSPAQLLPGTTGIRSGLGTFGIIAVLCAVLAGAGCGVSVGTVEDAVGDTSTTLPDTDSTDTIGPTSTRRSTTTVPTTRPADDIATAYVDAMTESMIADEDFPATRKDAECLATKFVDIIGGDRLRAAGVTPEEFADDTMDFSDVGITESQANKMYDAFDACNFDLRELMMSEMAEDDDLTPAATACMDQVLTEENLRKLMVRTMVGGEDAADADPELQDILGGFMGCAFMAMGDGNSDATGGDFTFD